jgi:putative Mg2+ transporter-C (MgtC) family protein
MKLDASTKPYCPLGILSGIGFIGAGLIARRDNPTMGMTIAVTNWVTKVIGLVVGAGYLGTGAVMVAITLFAPTVIKRAETLVFQEHRANMTVRNSDNDISDEGAYRIISSAGYKILRAALSLGWDRELKLDLTWLDKKPPNQASDFVNSFDKQSGAIAVNWQPEQESVME